jgi:phosphopentomutase
LKRRIFLIVLDSFGIGELPDADLYGDKGSNTLASIARAGLSVPNMVRLGLGNIDGVDSLKREENPRGAYARMGEKSKGKDSTVGHWEMAGIISQSPLPVYPNGFPKEIYQSLRRKQAEKFSATSPIRALR